MRRPSQLIDKPLVIILVIYIVRLAACIPATSKLTAICTVVTGELCLFYLIIPFRMNENHIQAQISGLRKFILGSTLVIAIIGIILSILLSQRITFPLKRLASYMHAFGRGDVEQEIDISPGVPLRSLKIQWENGPKNVII